MRARRAAWIAWSLLGVTLVTSCTSFMLVWLSRSARVEDVIGFRGFDALLAIVFASVGAVVVSQRPSNPVGWILLAFGASNAPISLAQQYALFALVGRAEPLPGGAIAAWAQEWVSVSQGALFVLVLLLFPTGRLLSRRWRPFVWIAVAGSILESIGGAFEPGPIATFRTLDNPFGLSGTGARLAATADVVGNVLFVATILAAVASVIVRFRRAQQMERQQLKWVVAATALVALGLVAFVLTGQESGASVYARPAQILLILAICAVPVSVGVAILRHRLYDIDRIISRTVSYGLVIAVLLGVYALVTLVPAAVIGRGGRAPDWQIAAGTLAAVALFQPMRRRIRTIVDRRFNRATYDASQTVDAFSLRLRDHIDLDTLGAELKSVVDRTMQPASTSLWLRKSRSAERKTAS